MTVLVLGSTGSTGSTGRRVTRQLRERGVTAQAASSHGEVVFDWSRPDTWGPALTDVSAIYVLAPDGVPVEEAFIQLAVAADVERLVLLSRCTPRRTATTACSPSRVWSATPALRGPSSVRTGSTRTSTRASSARRSWPANS